MYLDILVGIITLFAIYKGYSSGFFVSALSLFGILVSIVITRGATPKVINYLNIEGSEGTYFMIYALIFLVVYFLITLLLSFLESFIKVKKRTVLGIVLGSGLGILKGVALSFLLLLFYNLLGDHIGVLKKYGEESKANVVFKRSIPYAREFFPEKIGDSIENKKYREKIEKYIEDVLKESE